MNRRGFLTTLLLPFLPTPRLPWEHPISRIIIRDVTTPSRKLKTTFTTGDTILVGNVKNWDVRPISKLIEETQPMKELKCLEGYNYIIEFES